MRHFENSSTNRDNAYSIEQVANREKAELDRHQKKLIGYYLSGGDEDYIFRSDQNEYSERHITEYDKKQTLDLINSHPKFCKELERQLLMDIESFPPHGKENDEILSEIKNDKHQKRIMNYVLGGEWDDLDSLSSKDMKRFFQAYPTPIDFEADSDAFLQQIGERNTASKYQEYVASMKDFYRTVYGKKNDYYQAIHDLHIEALRADDNEHGRRIGFIALRGGHTREDLGSKSTKEEQLSSPERLVVDASALTLNKGILTGNRTRQNEDSSYYNPEAGLFAVFDGAGGIKGAARASGMALEILRQLSNQKMPNSAMDLKDIAEKIHYYVHTDKDAGVTTGVFGKIIEDEDGKRLAYVSLGDSRIYRVRGQDLKQLTKDDGEHNAISNALGYDKKFVITAGNMGDEPLRKGDRIVFCSDGITGDWEEDFIPDREFAQIVSSAPTAKDASNALIRRATKIDDRTVIVVEV